MLPSWLRGYCAPVGEPIARWNAASVSDDSLAGRPESWTFVDSGTSALVVALTDAVARSDKSSPAEVILPAYCCPQVLSAIVHIGARPVLVDLERGSPFMSFDAIRSALTAHTVAVVAINFLGIPERTAMLRELLPPHTKLIYDCCQAFPDTDRDLDCADYVVLSFGRGKPVTLLHGGAVYSTTALTQAASSIIGEAEPESRLRFRLKATIYDAARKPAVFPWLVRAGLADKTEYAEASAPHSMNALARSMMPANIHAYRQRNTHVQQHMTALFKDVSVITDLAARHCTPDNTRLLRYPVLCRDRSARDELTKALRARGMGASAFYALPLAQFAPAELKLVTGDYPEAQKFADTLLTLPVHGGVSKHVLAGLRDLLQTTASNTVAHNNPQPSA